MVHLNLVLVHITVLLLMVEHLRALGVIQVILLAVVYMILKVMKKYTTVN